MDDNWGYPRGYGNLHIGKFIDFIDDDDRVYHMVHENVYFFWEIGIANFRLKYIWVPFSNASTTHHHVQYSRRGTNWIALVLQLFCQQDCSLNGCECLSIGHPQIAFAQRVLFGKMMSFNSVPVVLGVTYFQSDPSWKIITYFHLFPLCIYLYISRIIPCVYIYIHDYMCKFSSVISIYIHMGYHGDSTSTPAAIGNPHPGRRLSSATSLETQRR